MASSPPDSLSGNWSEEGGVPAAWDRRYRRWAQRVVEPCPRAPAPPGRARLQPLPTAGLVVVMASALAWGGFLVLASLFEIFPTAALLFCAAGLVAFVWLAFYES